MIETENRILDLLRDLIIIPSTASNPDALDHAVKLVRNHIDVIPGIEVEEHESGGRPSFVARPEGLGGPVEVLLVGHVDVVEAEPEGFSPRIEGNRIYARGAGDMKGAVAVMTELYREFLERRPSLPLGLMITADEESGGRHGVGHLVNEKGYRTGLAIIPDSGSLNEIVVMEKGILAGRVVSRGRAGHSARPWDSDNAVHRLMENLARLRTRFDSFDTGDGKWRHTVSVNVLGTRNVTPNRVPGSARAVIDIRFTEEKTADGMLALLEEVFDEHTEFHSELISEPLMTEPDPAFVRITEEITGNPVRLVREHGGSDGRFFTRLKIPVIMSRPNVGGLHSDNEWIETDSMLQYYRILAAFLREKFPEAA